MLRKASDPVQLWRKFLDGVVVQDTLCKTIEKELQSSYDWHCMCHELVLMRRKPDNPQVTSFQSPPHCPTLTSSAIEWEQSLVAGRPTHPVSLR